MVSRDKISKSGGSNGDQAPSLRVRTGIKSGGITPQHSRRILKVTTGFHAGGICVHCGGNHSRRLLSLFRKHLAEARRAYRRAGGLVGR